MTFPRQYSLSLLFAAAGTYGQLDRQLMAMASAVTSPSYVLSPNNPTACCRGLAAAHMRITYHTRSEKERASQNISAQARDECKLECDKLSECTAFSHSERWQDCL